MYLVTGTAGFIGCETALALLQRGEEVVGIDNLNDYYDVQLKHDRLSRLSAFTNYRNHEFCLSDAATLKKLFADYDIQNVVHLAAQAGVRYSLEHPEAYIQSNLVGFANILESCRHSQIKHLIYASSSSVYGANTRQPYRETDNVDHPLSLYAATKKSNELMAHTYSHLYGLPTTGLRFFTVYGPWGRPDMAPIKFAQKIMAGEPIDVYNYGNHHRDFTYIDDIVNGIIGSVDTIAMPNPAWSGDLPDPSTSRAPYRLYNIGCSAPVHLLNFIELLEKSLGKSVEKNMLPIQPGDVPDTYASVEILEENTGYKPKTNLTVGIEKFADWFLHYYKFRQ